nr:hypothetical protein CFP56_27570 [Quercus suber]
MDNPSEAYYTSGTSDSVTSNPGKQLIFSHSGYLYILRDNNQTLPLKQCSLLAVLVNIILIVAICVGVFSIHRKKLKTPMRNVGTEEMNLRCFNYQELVEATNGFKEELEIDKEINFRAATTVIQSEPFPVEGQILGSNPSLIRGGTTSYSFWNHHWDVKRQQERRARKKNCKHRSSKFWISEFFTMQINVNVLLFIGIVLGTHEISSAYNSNAIRKHKLGKIKSSTLLVVVQNTKPKGEQPPGNEYQNLLLYLKSTITIPMSYAAKLVSMSALTIQKLPMQLLRPKYSLLTVTNKGFDCQTLSHNPIYGYFLIPTTFITRMLTLYEHSP